MTRYIVKSLAIAITKFYRTCINAVVASTSHLILGNEVTQNRVPPGDAVELGVFKGGSTSVLVHTFEKCAHKRFWFYDSFAGHPEIDEISQEPRNAAMEGKAYWHT